MKRVSQTDGRTNRRTEPFKERAAWSQLIRSCGTHSKVISNDGFKLLICKMSLKITTKLLPYFPGPNKLRYYMWSQLPGLIFITPCIQNHLNPPSKNCERFRCNRGYSSFVAESWRPIGGGITCVHIVQGHHFYPMPFLPSIIQHVTYAAHLWKSSY